MTNIEPETTKLVITMKHVWYIIWGLGGSVLVLALIGWGILNVSLSGVEKDIADVRTDIRALSGTDRDVTNRSAETEISLRDLIASLDKNVFAMSQNLASFTKSTEGQMQVINASFGDMKTNWTQTNDAIVSISNRLTRIEQRFETAPYSPDAPPQGGDGTKGGGFGNDSPTLLPEPQ